MTSSGPAALHLGGPRREFESSAGYYPLEILDGSMSSAQLVLVQQLRAVVATALAGLNIWSHDLIATTGVRVAGAGSRTVP